MLEMEKSIYSVLIYSLACCISLVSARSVTKGIDFPMKFLMSYGYLPRSDLETNQLRSKAEIISAIKTMQRMAHIPVTGELDNATRTKMSSPRCGMADMDEQTNERTKRYITASKWESTHVTWRLDKGSYDLTNDVVKDTLREAMKFWGDVSQLTFREVPGSVEVDMHILFGSRYHGDSYPFDAQGGVLAHAFYPNPGWGGDLHFDESEDWTVDSYEGQNLLYVAVHELGHALGLRHSDVEDSIMYPYARGYDPNLKLFPDDIAGIQSLYGKPKEPEPSAGPTTTTSTSVAPTAAPTVPPTRPVPGHCPQTIDALAVIRGESFIFNGMDYWRYNNYGMMNQTPLPVRGLWKLPEEVKRIDAAYMRPYGGDYKIVFFSGKSLFEFDGTTLSATRSLTDIGIPSDVDHIDAAFVWGLNDMTYLVSGRMYWRYDDTTKSVLADYPRDMNMWQGVPTPVDSAFSSYDRDGIYRTYFFKGLKYYEIENDVMKVRATQRPPFTQFWTECFADLLAAAEETSAAPALRPLAVLMSGWTLLVFLI